MGCLESRSATIANTYDKILEFYNDLFRIENKFNDKNKFLSENSIILRNLVYKRLKAQTKMTLFSYSLTVKGRKFFRVQANMEGSNPQEDNQTHGYLEDFFMYSILEDQREMVNVYENENDGFEMDSEYEEIEESYSNEEIEESNIDKKENWVNENEYEEDLIENEISFDINEYDGTDYFSSDEIIQEITNRKTNIKKETIENIINENVTHEQKIREIGVIRIGCDFIRKYGIRSNLSEEKISSTIQQYINWMEMDSLSEFEHILNFSKEFIWHLVGFSSKWSELAELAKIITSIPSSEVENERVFSVKRHIIGKSSVRTSPELLTARTRIAMQKNE